MHVISNRFNYIPLTRTDGKVRLYNTPDGSKLPSVTTILDATKDKTHLYEWRKRMGNAKANEITKEAAGVGTAMHKSLEKYLKLEDRTPSSNLVHKIGYDMANIIISKGLDPKFTELWGNEISLWHTKLYAGTTDCMGVYDSADAIVDFKQTNRPKKIEWIEDYFLQLAAYALAHNETHGTDIKQGVILMCSADFQYQEFVVEGDEFAEWTEKWLTRVQQYYQLY